MTYATQFLWKRVSVIIDRPLATKHPKHWFIYCLNYGYIPKTKAPDGEEVDAYILWVYEPIQEFEWICIAVIQRQDDDDDKLIVVPHWIPFSDEQIQALVAFQERFFQSKIVR